jgi:hypothetical protein
VNYPVWANDVMEMDADKRIALAEDILNDFAKKNRKSAKLARAIADRKEFEYYTFNTHLHFLPIRNGRAGTAELSLWKTPQILVKHKKLPLSIIVGGEWQRPLSRGQKISKISEGSPVKQHLKWVEMVSSWTTERKKSLVDKLISGLRAQKKSKKPGQKWLSDFLEAQTSSNSEFILKGFCINCCYLRIDGEHGDIKPLWIHPWGTPQLLFTHRDFPAIMIVGPSMRLNENVFGQKDMVGYTG